jgi:hypothetical protein
VGRTNKATDGPSPLNIYWPQDLADEFAALRSQLSDLARLSNSKLGEVALRQFLNKYSEDPHQLLLDLGLK